MSETRKLHVIARIKPDSESKSDGSSVLRAEGNSRVVLQDANNNSSYEFDRVYGARSTTEQLYKESIEPTVSNKFCSGNNYLVVAYGATGAGKTHTLYGDKHEQEGLVQKSVETIFSKLEANKTNQKFLVTISIYQLSGTSSITDLMNPQTKINYAVSAHRYLGCVIEGLAQIEVTNAEQTLLFIKQALQVKAQLDLRAVNTQTGGPNKSHAFIDINLETVEKDNPSIIKTSLLRFALLAGSGGVNLKFNTGLQAVNKIIDLLAAEKENSILNYNGNSLTQLLEFGLGGGNALTSMILFMNPSSDTGSSSTIADCVHSLELGEKARRIKNSTKVNKNTLNSSIRDLREEIKKLRGKLNLSQPGQYLHDINPNDLKNLKNLNAQLELLKRQTWEKKRERSRQFVEKRKENLLSEGLSAVLEEEISVPENILNQSKNLLNNIVQAKLALEETQYELTASRTKYQQIMESNENPDQLNPDQLNLDQLSAEISELSDRYRSQQSETEQIVDEYKKILTKISTIEARQRKMFLLHKDSASFESLNKKNEFAEMKKEIDSDPNYLQAIQSLNQNTEKTQHMLRDRFDQSNQAQDPNLTELRDETVKLIEDLRIQSEYSKKLEFERDLLWAKLIENQFKNTVEFNRYQEHLYFIFKNYRQHFEEQKIRMENKYREMLDSSVKDALKLAEENTKLRMQLEAKKQVHLTED